MLDQVNGYGDFGLEYGELHKRMTTTTVTTRDGEEIEYRGAKRK